MAKTKPLTTILEIGSSSGEGSTEAFVKGISENPNHPTLFCMEISGVRFAALEKYYQDYPFVKCYRASSVPIEAFPSKDEVYLFLQKTRPKTVESDVKEVLRWLQQDIDYIAASGVPQMGIEWIREENGIEDFDMVLIDHSPLSVALLGLKSYGGLFERVWKVCKLWLCYYGGLIYSLSFNKVWDF